VTEHEDLLKRYAPHLKYDTNEGFFADAPEEWTDQEYSVLRRRNADGTPGDVIASGSPKDGEAKLDMGFLGAAEYRDKTPVEPTDFITWTRSDHRDQFNVLHQREDYRNRVYGRTQRDGDNRLWLQYWFYYIYNDYNMAGGFGLHEGDWEGIQLLMEEDEKQPELAVYAQHKHAEYRAWRDVELRDGVTPVVYVGRGSHASYFTSGSHQVGIIWWDYCDGEREPSDLRLEVITGNEPWASWPGVWGATMPRHPPLDQSSPAGPCRPKGRWFDPRGLLKGAETDREQPPLPPKPSFDVSREGRRLTLGFDLSSYGDAADAPERLVVTVNRAQPPEQKPREPPRTHSFAVAGVRKAQLALRDHLNEGSAYTVSVSATTPDGRPTPSNTKRMPIPDLTLRERAVEAWGRFGEGLGGTWRRFRGRR
jgi:hemolysin-activating ACP:hemolysin acyltransferase